MRADMGKVLVERPRVGSRHLHGKSGKGYKKRVRRALASDDGGPCREGITRMYNDLKHFGEHLGPLRRFIEANVGRPWDKVYGEMCQHVDRGNVVQKHILTHLFDYVAVDVELIGGEPFRKVRSRWRGHEHPLRGPNQWYVCPKSGLLKRAKAEDKRERRKRWQGRVAEPERPVGWVSDRRCVIRTRDGWQLVTVAKWLPVELQPGPWRVLPRDVLLHTDDVNRLERYYGKRVYAVAVRPLSAGEMNDLPVTLPGKLKAPNVVR